MGNIWFFGDPHFGHANIIKYCNRPFRDVNEMNECLVANWNDLVRPEDQAFILGDFALGTKEDIIRWGKELYGHKTLILGNHDRASMKTYYDAGFEFVSKHPLIFDEFIILSHHPQNIAADGRYANIFAHVHDNPMYHAVSPLSYCVSAERIDYRPVSYDTVKEQMENFVPAVDGLPASKEIIKPVNSSCCRWLTRGDLADYCLAESSHPQKCNCKGNQKKCDFYDFDAVADPYE